ncbi:sulfatase-like hydrolase/transferase [Polaribacter litorisediminis]|uniref:sulfatase-like hydrolase/transferase n=1 Tax=Polaribacter litorisediminis TaxID=1908341 RepID=UPI001CBB81EF|nr:sulfatase-like hydrolase/transferase [Polaribacter litorisediminis]UAM97973.1 sulfatase-like hydrolase/transferase [Polaribacter litorisediminis]
MLKHLKSIKNLFLACCIFSIVNSCADKNKRSTLVTVKVNSDKITPKNQPTKKPNIIVILVDDAGYVDFGFMGSKDLETPEIDKLAKEGVIFTDAHVSATVCAPSRAGIISGKYQQRFGFEANGTGYGNSGDIGLSDDVITIADVLKKDSYQTVALGKWHLGATKTDHPNNRGFDDFYGFLAGGRSYFPLKNPSEELMLQHNHKRVEFDGYLTDVLGDYSVKFVEEHQEKPFFMYLAYNAVHTPMHAKKEHLLKYKNHSRKKLAAMTWSLDENVGKLVKKLKELNLLDNTLIYFLSDNGGATTNTANNGYLKGWKGNKFEGGHRVPFLMSWPNQIKGGVKFDGLTSSLDIFSTSIAAAKINNEGLAIDGVDLLPYLKNAKKGNPHTDLYWRKLEESGARYNDYKLIKLKNYGERLYNLEYDIGETKDLSKSDTSTLNLMNSKLKNWESKMIAPLWQEEKEWMDVTYHIHKRLMQNKEVLYKEPTKNMNISQKRP